MSVYAHLNPSTNLILVYTVTFVTIQKIFLIVHDDSKICYFLHMTVVIARKDLIRNPLSCVQCVCQCWYPTVSSYGTNTV